MRKLEYQGYGDPEGPPGVVKPEPGPIYAGWSNYDALGVPNTVSVAGMTDPHWLPDWEQWEICYEITEEAKGYTCAEYHEWAATWDPVEKRWYANEN